MKNSFVIVLLLAVSRALCQTYDDYLLKDQLENVKISVVGDTAIAVHDTKILPRLYCDTLLSSCRFEKEYSFKNDTFAQYVSFGVGIFERRVTFDRDEFLREVIFHNCHFEKEFTFTASNVDYLELTQSVFRKGMDLRWCNVNDLNLSGSTIKNYADFYAFRCQSATFVSAEVHDARFVTSKFANGFVAVLGTFDGADFTESTIRGLLNFSKARLRKKINFSQSEIDSAIFSYAELPDTLIFDNATIKTIVDLSDAIGRKPCHISLNFVDLRKFKLNYANFELICPSNDTVSSTLLETLYLNLIESQKNFPKGKQKASIEYKQLTYRSGGLWGKALNIIDLLWWNYGYNKERIIAWMLCSFITLSCINIFCLNILNGRVYQLENIPLMAPLLSGRQKARRVWYSFLYTGHIFFRLTLKPERLNIKTAASLYVLFIYIWGVICLAYFANFVIQK
jgi:uncharacterized protein YjbI with pentapeptide repeats